MAEEYTVAMETKKADLLQHVRTRMCTCDENDTRRTDTNTRFHHVCLPAGRVLPLRCSKMEMSFYINAMLTVFPRREKVFRTLIIAR